jgi:hypothetical protein
MAVSGAHSSSPGLSSPLTLSPKPEPQDYLDTKILSVPYPTFAINFLPALRKLKCPNSGLRHAANIYRPPSPSPQKINKLSKRASCCARVRTASPAEFSRNHASYCGGAIAPLAGVRTSACTPGAASSIKLCGCACARMSASGWFWSPVEGPSSVVKAHKLARKIDIAIITTARASSRPSTLASCWLSARSFVTSAAP